MRSHSAARTRSRDTDGSASVLTAATSSSSVRGTKGGSLFAMGSKSNRTNVMRSLSTPRGAMSGFGTASAISVASVPVPPASSADSDDDFLVDELKDGDAAVTQAKGDLLQLGIKLEDDVIERLQKNLKIEKIFQIAHQASKIVTKRAVEADNLQSTQTPTDSPLRSTILNNATNSNSGMASPTNKVVPPHPVASILQPRSAIQVDEREAAELLLRIENGRAGIAPQYKSIIEHVIDTFRLAYARHPDRFICRLLGKPMPTAATVTASLAAQRREQEAEQLRSAAAAKAAAEAEAEAEAELQRQSASSKKFRGTALKGTSAKTATVGNKSDKANAPITPLTIGTTVPLGQGTKVDDAQTIATIGAEHSAIVAANAKVPMTRAALQRAVEQQILDYVLQQRYILEQEFAAMLLRILPSTLEDPAQIARVLFELLSETKRFQSNRKKQVVDLWGFLTFLKVAAEESRRSFDATTSRLATEVEFWRHSNGSHVVLTSNSTINNNQPSSTASRHQTTADYSHDSMEVVLDPSRSSSAKKRTHDFKHRVTREESSTVAQSQRVSQLMGSEHREHCSKGNQGRRVMGRLNAETVNACDVSEALHSPPRQKTRISTSLPNNALQSENHMPVPDGVTNSARVAWLLGQQALVDRQQSHVELEREGSTNGHRVRTANRFYREQYQNNTVGGVLQGKDLLPPPPPSHALERQVAGKSTNQNRTVASPSRRLSWASANHIFWEAEPASVASALGANRRTS